MAALASERAFVSDRLGWKNPNLLLFRLLYAYRDCAFYAPSLDAVIVAETTGQGLRLHDVVARRMPAWDELAPLLGGLGQETVAVLFCADQLGLQGASLVEVADDLLFVDDRFDLAGPFVFPGSLRA